MKKQLLALIIAVAALGTSAVPAQASYIGSLGFPMKKGANALEVGYQTGSREVEFDGGGEDDLESNGIVIQYGRGLGNGLEFFGRLTPTGEMEFDLGGGDFDVFGLGGGVRWSPRQQGAFKFGLQFSFDWTQGDDGDTDIDTKEILFAGGGSYRINKNVDAYGGLSLLKLDGTVDGPGAGDADFESDNTFGLFGGFDLKPSQNFTVGVELRLVNETAFGVTGRFKF